MRVAVESDGTLVGDFTRVELEELVDALAVALLSLNEFEVDVTINYETRELEFFLIIDAPGPGPAMGKVEEIIDQALAAAGVVTMQWDEAHARRADLIPA